MKKSWYFWGRFSDFEEYRGGFKKYIYIYKYFFSDVITFSRRKRYFYLKKIRILFEFIYLFIYPESFFIIIKGIYYWYHDII